MKRVRVRAPATMLASSTPSSIAWMLREAGKQSRAELIEFLKRNYSKMPRTALRYAIEHLSNMERKHALKGIFA